MNDNTLVSYTISNGDAKVKWTFKELKELSSLIPLKVIINKGHNVRCCFNELADKFLLRVFSISLSDIVSGYYLIGSIELKLGGSSSNSWAEDVKEKENERLVVEERGDILSCY